MRVVLVPPDLTRRIGDCRQAVTFVRIAHYSSRAVAGFGQAAVLVGKTNHQLVVMIAYFRAPALAIQHEPHDCIVTIAVGGGAARTVVIDPVARIVPPAPAVGRLLQEAAAAQNAVEYIQVALAYIERASAIHDLDRAIQGVAHEAQRSPGRVEIPASVAPGTSE